MRLEPSGHCNEVDNGRMRRIGGALFIAGFATFSLIWNTQPLLPHFSADFGIDPTASSLAVSVTTGTLAISILCIGALSEAWGRRGLMFGAIAAAAALNIVASIAPGWNWLLAARALEGVVLGGVPAVAMAYLAEEVAPRRLGFSMGLYVSGTAFGGMIGRVAVGALAEAISWRGAMAVVGLIDLVMAFVFLAMLPRSLNFAVRKNITVRAHLAAWGEHLRTPGLPALFLVGFLSLGGFIAVYNYIGFRLAAAPYGLNSAQVGLIFFAYLGGVVASSCAGMLADRIGRGPVMMVGAIIVLIGLAITLLQPLWIVVTGITLVTIGFFMVHSVASGWVGRIADKNRGHASSLYLLSYYAGASVLGWAGGQAWRSEGWNGVTAYAAIAFIAVLGIAALLMKAKDPGGRAAV